MQKECRNMKVCEQSGYKYKATPTIILKGQWLEELGFNIGDPVLVKCEDGKLIITLDVVKMEMLEAEKAFMEQESKKLKEKFRKEHKELMANYVAENIETCNLPYMEWKKKGIYCIIVSNNKGGLDMGLFTKKIGAVFLKETSDTAEFIRNIL